MQRCCSMLKKKCPGWEPDVKFNSPKKPNLTSKIRSLKLGVRHRIRNLCLSSHWCQHISCWPKILVLTVVDEMCFFFNFGTATNVCFDGMRGISLRGCAMQLSSVQKAGGRQAAIPRDRPPQPRNDQDPPHTAEGPPQARQAVASPICWSIICC